MTKQTAKDVKDLKELVDNVVHLKNTLKDSGFDWNEFIQKPHPRLDRFWVILPCVLLLLTVLAMIFWEPIPDKGRVVLFISGFSFCGWLAISTHLRYEKITTTGIAGIFGILILLVASKFITPKEAADQALNLMQSTSSK